MASLFKKERSPFWWIKYRNQTGTIKRESTKYRIGIGPETRKALELKAEYTLRESKSGSVRQSEFWQAWVPSWLELTYGGSPKTLERYQTSWRSIRIYLDQIGVFCPRQLTYSHVFEYIPWRIATKTEGVFNCSKNTALHEIKFLRIVMKEAVRRNFASHNPCVQLGIKKDPPPEKPELTDKDIADIRAGLASMDENGVRKWPEWMSIAFEIAIYQGCRLSETEVELKNLNLAKREITFHAKGGKIFRTQLHKQLIPLFHKMISERRKKTFDLPDLPSKIWWRFFKSIGKPKLCFHCTRVTVVTRLARAKVPIAEAMRFVGHASQTIHRVYQRIGTEDLNECVSALVYET